MRPSSEPEAVAVLLDNSLFDTEADIDCTLRRAFCAFCSVGNRPEPLVY